MTFFRRPFNVLLSSFLALASCSSNSGSVTGEDAGVTKDAGDTKDASDFKDAGNSKDAGDAKEGGKTRDSGDVGTDARGPYACADASTEQTLADGPITVISCVDAGGVPSCTGTVPYSCPNDPTAETDCYCGATSWSSGAAGWVCIGRSCGTGTGIGPGSDAGSDAGSGAGSGSGS
jgi:hypothetical protein